MYCWGVWQHGLGSFLQGSSAGSQTTVEVGSRVALVRNPVGAMVLGRNDDGEVRRRLL